eukprot:5624461-Alexandrium_andersonii.AAC.1
MQPSRASGATFEIVSGAVQFKFRTPQATCAVSGLGSAGGLRNRFDRFDSLVGSFLEVSGGA